MFDARMGLRAGLAATVAAGLALAGCGVTSSNTPPSTHRSAGYKVLAGGVSPATLGAAGLASGGWPEVPSAAGKWWAVPPATAIFNRSSKVELLATGKPGVRFHLGWEETCGGIREGRHGVLGGSGGTGNLTLKTPALVLVQLPPPEGNLNGCYLATVVSLHAKTYEDAKTASPHVLIVHY